MTASLSIALTFDFDALSAVIIENKGPTWMSYAEFGARVGADRILHELDRRGWHGTWFIPGHTVDSFREVCGRVHDAGHEIGHHGYCHEDPSTLSEAQEREMLERGIASNRHLTGSAPIGYRAPFWRMSDRTLDLLCEYGFVYDASLMGNDFLPYRTRTGPSSAHASKVEAYNFGATRNLVEIPVAWHLEDGGHFEIPSVDGGPLRHPRDVVALWDTEIEFAFRHVPGGVVTLTMHPEITGRGSRLPEVFRLLDRWADRGVEIVRLRDYVAHATEAGLVDSAPEH